MPNDHNRKVTVHKPGQTARGYFGALFDFSFSRFITVQMFPVLYGVILLSTLVGAAYLTVEAFISSWWRGMFYLFVASPLGFVAIATVTRALMEFYIVVFKVAENIDEIRVVTERFSGISEGVESMRGLTKRIPFWGNVGNKNEPQNRVEEEGPKRPENGKRTENNWL